MDIDDFDDLDKPIKAPPRTSKFAPKSSKTKPQPRGKTQSQPPKSEAQEPVLAAKPEPQNAPVLRKKEDGEEEAKPKIEPLVLKDDVEKMEVDAKAEVEAVSTLDDPMEEDRQEEKEEEEEEDMIVREIDVYFNPSDDPESQLYVMQYPLRPSWRPYELDERCTEVRVKPQTKEVEVDLAIDDSTNWDHAQADKFNMKKQILKSSFMPSDTSGYTVGVLIGNKLHLNPVHAVVQLRPSLEHLDPIGSKTKSNAASNTGATVKLENPNEGKPGSSKKQVKRTELENDQISEAEGWIPLKYHGSKSESSAAYLKKMATQESSKIEFDMSPYDYMSSLCPAACNEKIKSKGPSRRVLLSLPLEERVMKLFSEEPPVRRFSVLKHFAPDHTAEELLTVLQKKGQLVQGFWTARANVLFPGENLKCLARDYILLSFSKSRFIKSSQLIFPTIKLKEDIKTFLNIFAVERPLLKDWKFKEETDFGFIKLYPEVVREQEAFWKKTEEIVKPRFTEKPKKNTNSSAAQSRPPVQQLNPERSTPRTTSASRVLRRTTISDETKVALLKALPKVLQNHKVCSFELICQGLRDLAISQSALPKVDASDLVLAASGADAPREELEEIISQIATNIHGSYVLKSSPEHPQFDEFRKVVIDLLLLKGRDARLKKADVNTAAKIVLEREPTSAEYTKVMTDICESKGSAWSLKSGDGKPS